MRTLRYVEPLSDAKTPLADFFSILLTSMEKRIVSTSNGKSDFDQAKADSFAGELLATLNHGALCLMISVGHRTGLFDVMSKIVPATSSEIAAQTGLNERYVREWLGTMVTSKVIDVNPETLQFSLPAEHAAFLTRAAAADNLAVFAQYIPVLGEVEDDIVECFRVGGGVPYSRYTRFHEVALLTIFRTTGMW